MPDPAILEDDLELELAKEQEEYSIPEPPPDPELMLQQLYSSDPSERIQAARAFCEIEDSRAIDRLLEFLVDDCPLLRVSAAYALGRNRSAKAIPVLIRQLQQDWNDYVRKGIVWALGTNGDRQALAVLQKTLQFDTMAVRLWTASALGQLGDPQAIPLLSDRLLHDAVPAVRSNCAWALGKLLPLESPTSDRYQTGIQALTLAKNDEDLGVRADAKEALSLLAIFDEDG
jgi:HEAT repeat protein